MRTPSRAPWPRRRSPARDELDALIERHAKGWALDRIAPLERAILRVALLEMLQPAMCPGTPRSRPRARSTRRSRRPRGSAARRPGFRERHPGSGPGRGARQSRCRDDRSRRLSDLAERLRAGRRRLRSGDVTPERAAELVDECARLGRRGRRGARPPGPGAGDAAPPAQDRCSPRRTACLAMPYPDELRDQVEGLPRRPALLDRSRPPPGSTRPCATRCWPAASGSVPCSRWRPRGPSRMRRGTRAAAGRRARADPHLLADPRRPARDGRRRPAPRARPPATRSTARTSPSWPATGSTPRRSTTVLRQPARGARADPRGGGRAGRRDRRRRAWSVASTSTCADSAPAGDAGLRRLHELKTGRLIGVVGRVRTAPGGSPPTCHNRASAPSRRSSACSSRSLTTSST